MSNFAVSPSTLVTVTLTPYVVSLIFIEQFSCAPTVAFSGPGQDTESGLLPAASVIFWLIWLSTSLLLTVLKPEKKLGSECTDKMIAQLPIATMLTGSPINIVDITLLLDERPTLTRPGV